MNNYFKNIWLGLYTTLIGLKITFGHIFTKKVTIQYPHERYPIPDIARNRLYVNITDCTGCKRCVTACPIGCITVEIMKSLPTEDLGTNSKGTKKKLWITKFEIDFAKCCFCGLCTSSCSASCIETTTFFEYSEYEREKLKYSFVNLTQKEIQQKKDAYAAYEKELAAQKTAWSPTISTANQPNVDNNETKTS
jgi:NADH-quinone oxidoreductase subunit I